MAKSTRTRRNLTQFPKSTEPPADPATTPTAVLDPPAEPGTPFDAAPPPEPEKPRKTPKTLTFFQRLASIDRGDWTGERAKVKLYRLAPLINRLAGSEHKFVAIYYEPITEEKLKVDHGSGRYRLYLNYKNAGIKEEKELDMVELDILDPAYPPKIPPGEWLDDPRNKQWAWARPAGAGQQPGQQPATDPMAHLNTFMDIQDRIEERMKPAEEAKTATPVDPWSAAEKILNMRSENPMVAILQQQMKDAATAAENERARAFTAAEAARDREFKLQEKLLEAKTAAPQPKSLFDQIGELVGPETVKKFIGDIFSGKGPGEAITRSSRVTGLEVARDITTKLIDSDILSGIGQWLAARAQQSAAMNNPAMTPAMNGTAIQNGVQPPEQDFNAFLRETLNPALLRHYTQGFSGADFAGWLYDGYPDQLVKLQNFTHPLAPGLKGAPVIIAGYKRTAHMWPALSVRGEEAFALFVHDFCAWKPESAQDAQDAESEDVEGQVIDLDEPEARVS